MISIRFRPFCSQLQSNHTAMKGFFPLLLAQYYSGVLFIWYGLEKESPGGKYAFPGQKLKATDSSLLFAWWNQTYSRKATQVHPLSIIQQGQVSLTLPTGEERMTEILTRERTYINTQKGYSVFSRPKRSPTFVVTLITVQQLLIKVCIVVSIQMILNVKSTNKLIPLLSSFKDFSSNYFQAFQCKCHVSECNAL